MITHVIRPHANGYHCWAFVVWKDELCPEKGEQPLAQRIFCEEGIDNGYLAREWVKQMELEYRFLDDENPLRKVIGRMRSDPDYRWTWQCNIAQQVEKEGIDSELSNKIARNFIRSMGVTPLGETDEDCH